MKSNTPDLRGRAGPSRATYWMMAPLVFFGLLRIIMKVAHEFSESPEQGVRALLNIGIGLLGVVLFTAILVLAADGLFLARARRASGTKELILLNLSLNSYQQAFDLTGKPAFHPKWDQGVYVAVRHNALELYAGFKKYSGYRMRIAFSRIRSIRREEVRIFARTAPGLVIETDKGSFELGFVPSAFIAIGRVPARVAEERYRRIESAWTAWVEQQALQDKR